MKSCIFFHLSIFSLYESCITIVIPFNYFFSPSFFILWSIRTFFITVVTIHMIAAVGVQGKITPVLCRHRIKTSLASKGFSVKQGVNREEGTRP